MYSSVISRRVQERKNEYKENRYRLEWENFERFVAKTMIVIISVDKQNTVLYPYTTMENINKNHVRKNILESISKSKQNELDNEIIQNIARIYIFRFVFLMLLNKTPNFF